MTRSRRIAPGLAILVAALFVALPFAFAHARPKTMDPAPDSVVASPAKITVTFSEAVEPKFSSLALADEKGNKVSKETSKPVAGDSRTLTLALPTLPAGGYLVQWVSVAPDGHRMEGEYKFTVK